MLHGHYFVAILTTTLLDGPVLLSIPPTPHIEKGQLKLKVVYFRLHGEFLAEARSKPGASCFVPQDEILSKFVIE